MPPARPISRRYVLARRQRRCPVNRDAVVIPKDDQPTQPEMPGKANCFMVNALHQAPVPRDDICMMIDKFITELRVQMALGNRHADRHRQPLPQWSGRALHTFKLEILRMPRTRTAQLAEVADVSDRRAGISCQIQRRISQHRAVSS